MNQLLDKTSYRNRGGLWKKLVSGFKSRKYFTTYGHDVVVKKTAVFKMVDNALLNVGNGVTIQDYAYFLLSMPEPKVYIGDNTVIGRNNIITCKNHIHIGNDVLIGSDVQIIDHGHGISRGELIRTQHAEIGKVFIGDDVWIGTGAKILMNSNIGRGAVIGADSVVNGEIPEYGIAAGIPARVIRFRS